MKSSCVNFEPVSYYQENGFFEIPNEKGVYIVCSPTGFTEKILPSTTAITEYKGGSLLYSVSYLENKWVSNSDILYIGKGGGNTSRLRQCIRQLVKYSYGEGHAHRGGRALWQLENNKELLVGYRLVEQPEQLKQQLLLEFIQNYGALPFANML